MPRSDGVSRQGALSRDHSISFRGTGEKSLLRFANAYIVLPKARDEILITLPMPVADTMPVPVFLHC